MYVCFPSVLKAIWVEGGLQHEHRRGLNGLDNVREEVEGQQGREVEGLCAELLQEEEAEEPHLRGGVGEGWTAVSPLPNACPPPPLRALRRTLNVSTSETIRKISGKMRHLQEICGKIDIGNAHISVGGALEKFSYHEFFPLRFATLVDVPSRH